MNLVLLYLLLLKGTVTAFAGLASLPVLHDSPAQVELLLGPDHCVRLEPSGEAASIEMDDYDAAYAALPALAGQHFEVHKEALRRFFEAEVAPRERHYCAAHRC